MWVLVLVLVLVRGVGLELGGSATWPLRRRGRSVRSREFIRFFEHKKESIVLQALKVVGEERGVSLRKISISLLYVFRNRPLT